MRKFFRDFKDFAVRGNVVDMAVGVVIGSAFGKIVTSVVSDIIMPLISLLVGNVSFSEWKVVFAEAQYDAEGVLVKAESALTYGNLIQAIFDFVIIAFCIFVVIRFLMKFKKKEEEAPKAPPAPSNTEVLLQEIRDLLAENKQLKGCASTDAADANKE